MIGTLLSSWLNASNRLTNFAVLRALGMATRQVSAVLLWEQGFVYILAFLLGTGLGGYADHFRRSSRLLARPCRIEFPLQPL